MGEPPALIDDTLKVSDVPLHMVSDGETVILADRVSRAVVWKTSTLLVIESMMRQVALLVSLQYTESPSVGAKM